MRWPLITFFQCRYICHGFIVLPCEYLYTHVFKTLSHKELLDVPHFEKGK